MTKLIYCIKISKLDGVSLSLTLPGQGQCVALVIIILLGLDGNEFSTKPEKLPGRSFQNFSMLWGIPGRIADRTLTLTFTMTLK